MRGRLQLVAARSSALDELFEAYDVASVALERFQKEKNCPQVLEYEVVCTDIENELIEHLLNVRFDVPL